MSRTARVKLQKPYGLTKLRAPGIVLTTVPRRKPRHSLSWALNLNGPRTLDLPSPPTANTYWRRAGHRIHLSKRGEAFKSAASARWLVTFRNSRIAFPTGNVKVSIAWRRKRAIGDTDNIAKPILDALKKLAYTDDNQVTELHITRTDDKRNPGVTVTISRAA